MDHTHIVQASDLDRYAPTRESQAVIPELIYWLVKQCCPELTVCRIPYGDAVNQPGWDGLVETPVGYREFIPDGKSYWEIGTGADPQSKATTDFKKRTDEIAPDVRAVSSFVFVTPRSGGSGGWNEPEQTKWLERRKDKGWKLIRIVDGVKLADWLREFPAIGKWMATKIPLTANLGGLATPTEHWENLVSESVPGDPPIPPELFTIGRDAACDALRSVFEGNSQLLQLFAESPLDVADFVSAFLATLDAEQSRDYGNRCLLISDEQAWRSIAEARSPHILVADPRLGLETDEGAALQSVARRRGHGLVVPLCGAWSGTSPGILKLRSPSQSQIESILKEAGYTDTRARELGRIAGDRISALRRHLRGYGTLPPYATWDNATQIAQAGLAGKWDGANPSDRAALEMLLGKGYGEWIDNLRPNTLHSASPLIQRNEKWRFVARGEAWKSLGSRVTDDDLKRFQETAIFVLSERDPKLELPRDQRYMAGVYGKTLAHSNELRNGVAETLALIGSYPQALKSCTEGRAQSTTISIVRTLLSNANWEQWAGLNSVLPLIAEAAPDEFLDAVESALVDLENTPFHKLFEEEGGAGLGGSNYMTGLLWALETLAWSPDFLSRVSVILADLASFDPGGNWANRPSNSLADIFLPWHVQTTASIEKRVSAVEAVIREQPTVGWKLLLSLLPHSHGVTSGCHRPVWRDFIPRDWDDAVSKSEYWRQISAYTELAVALAKTDTDRLCELVKRLPDLPETAHQSLLQHLKTESVKLLSEAERAPLWESINELVRQHRKFSHAVWAMPEDAISNISEAAKSLAPTKPEHMYHYLFTERDSDLFETTGDYEQQRKQLEENRQEAVAKIIEDGGVDAVLRFARKVAAPHQVGQALGAVATDEIERHILPSLLDSEEDAIERTVAGFVWSRFWRRRTEWVDAVLERDWPTQLRARFLTLLPFKEEVWQRASTNLNAENESLYWENVRVNPYAPESDLQFAIEKLLEYGREASAVNCVARTAGDKSQFDETLATRALLAVLKSERGVRELDHYETVELIKRLQESENADQDAVFQIEWNFLAWLDRFSSGSPSTLENRLSSDPAFFAELIRLVFRSRNGNDAQEDTLDERRKQLATNAYKLLMEWKRCPGTRDDGTFDADKFNEWLNDARRITEESGHAEVAQIQIGHVLTCAPPDPDGLWIHNTVASALNFRDTGEMRSGFVNQLYNDRGVHSFSHGEEERKLAQENRNKAELLESRGYTRFATAMREFAEQYEREAEREANRNPFDE